MSTAIQQRQAAALVSSDVLLNMNGFIQDILEGENSCYFEEAQSLAMGSANFEECARNSEWLPVAEHVKNILANVHKTEGDTFDNMDRLRSIREQLTGKIKDWLTWKDHFVQVDSSGMVYDEIAADDWQEVCNYDNLDYDDYRNEALEFWAVSHWLAGKLEQRGERLEEIHGAIIWGRTCSGQSISIDSVIEDITKELHGDEYGKDER